MMSGRSIFIFMLMVILSGTFLNSAIVSVEAVGEPDVTLRFHEGEEEQVADVRPGEHGTVTFPGIVTVTNPAGSTVQDVIVKLNGSTTLNWPVTIKPDTINVEPGGEETFSVTVSVPPETSYYIMDTLTVSGTAEPIPGAGEYNIDPITGSIRIAQFYKFSLECDEPSKEVGLGEECQFQLKIWNYGNGRDSFVVSIPGLNRLNEEGFIVTMGTYTIDVEEKSQNIITVSVKAPTGKSSLGLETIEIEVRSEQQEILEGTAFPKTYPLSVKVVDNNGGTDDKGGGGLPSFEGSLAVIALLLIIIISKRKYF
jgi:uncharacterized membrane protein